MGVSQQWAKYQKRDQRKADQKQLTREERKSLHKLRMEARAKGTKLESAGRGGLSPSLILHVFRRDDYQCKVCGSRDRISVHHKAGVEAPTSEYQRKKDHSNDPGNLVSVCVPCHDRIHQKDRALEEKVAAAGGDQKSDKERVKLAAKLQHSD